MTWNAWRDLPVGTIVDSDILKLAEKQELFTAGFSAACVKQACYELRASDIFWDVASRKENKRIQITVGSGFVLLPNCFVVCIVKETIRLPPNVLGRIMTRGRLFSTGILPVNTYADPGFEGRLGITLYNGSRRPLIIRPDEPIAKIEFQVLPKPVEHPYSGQHGYETEIWPIASHLFANTEDGFAPRGEIKKEEDLLRSYGPEVADMYRRLNIYTRQVWWQIALMIFGFAVLFFLEGKLGLVESVLIGIVSNLATMWGLNLWTARSRRRDG